MADPSLGEVVVTASRIKKPELAPTKPNPLSKFSSVTYSAALYMLTPEAFNTYAETGSMSELKGHGNGVYIIAQSGGINNEIEDRLLTLDGTLGAGKEGYDYYIDNIVISSVLPGGENIASIGTNVKFKIIETQGFSFLTDMIKASRELNAESEILKDQPADYEANGFNQHFVLGIKFYGYDVNGKMVTSGSPEVQGYDNGGGDGDENAVIQRYFQLKIANMKFKLDGKMVVYNVEAVIVGEQVAFGNMQGEIKETMTIRGRTVGDILSGTNDKSSKSLAEQITEAVGRSIERQQNDVEYKVSFEFLDENNKETKTGIPAARLINDATFNSKIATGSQEKSATQVNIADSYSSTSFDTQKQAIVIKGGSKISAVIDSIITKSEFVTEALNTVKTQDAEAKNVSKTATKPLQWYSVNPVVQAKGINKNKTWIYDIKFQIKPYNVFFVRSNYVGKNCVYTGPYKRYNYLFTGENTEILSYTQEYNQLYYVTSSMSTNADEAPNKTGSVPVVPKSTEKTDDIGAGLYQGAAINNSVKATLYSPGDQSMAKIKIMGDPDYLMTVTGISMAAGVNKLTGNDGSINPLSGQVLIEINFKMAIDYAEDGLMDITDKLQFYRTSKPRDAGIDGMVYRVIKVESTFSKGSFIQVLECIIVDESLLFTDGYDPSSEETDEDTDGRQ
jgi:hypothetical protein